MGSWVSIATKAFFDFIGRSLALGALIVAGVKLDSIPLFGLAAIGGVLLLLWVASAAGHLGAWGARIRHQKQLSKRMTIALGVSVVSIGVAFCTLVTFSMFEVIDIVLATTSAPIR